MRGRTPRITISCQPRIDDAALVQDHRDPMIKHSISRAVLVILAFVPLRVYAQPQPTQPPSDATAPAPAPAPTPTPTPTPMPPPEAVTRDNDVKAEPPLVPGKTSPEHPSDDDDDDATPNKHKKPKKKDITYKHGWLEFHGPQKTKLRLRLVLQPMARLGQASNVPDYTMDMIIRRARLGFDATIQKGVGLRFEIDVKNMHYEIHNMFGSWKPKKNLELQFGFIKAPGGIERDNYSFDLAFIERSVVTYLNKDHEVGLKLEGSWCEKRWRWAASVMRDPPVQGGGDPEDSPVIPMNVEKEDLTRPISKWNAAGRVIAAPSDAFEASVRMGLRFRPDEADFGEIAVEPYDSTFLTNRPWHGVWVSVSGDAAVVQPHFKAVVEGGFRRDGQQLEYPDGTISSQREINGGHLLAEVGYVVLGFTPDGEYGAAVDAAPLLKGWEIVTRVNAARIKPVDQGAARMVSVELGVHWEVSRHVRLQADFAYEKFGTNDHTLRNENLGGTRIWAQTWATLRL